MFIKHAPSEYLVEEFNALKQQSSTIMVKFHAVIIIKNIHNSPSNDQQCH